MAHIRKDTRTHAHAHADAQCESHTHTHTHTCTRMHARARTHTHTQWMATAGVLLRKGGARGNSVRLLHHFVMLGEVAQ